MTNQEKNDQSSFLAQFEQAKKDVEKLRQAFPELFDKRGRAIVAELRFPSTKDKQ